MTTITKELLDMQLPTGVYRSAAYDANGRLNLLHNVLLLEEGIRPGVRDDCSGKLQSSKLGKKQEGNWMHI
jgi:hypothetical protein